MVCAGSMFAQLSTRENDAIKTKLGARPTAGNMALNFGIDLNNGGTASLFQGNALAAGDLLTFKYYLADDLAIRSGLRLQQTSSKSKGDAFEPTAPGDVKNNNFVESSREYVLVPGIEKHFSNSNIFDVYAGADLYLGFGKDKTIIDVDYNNGDYVYYTGSTSTSIYGLGGVVGFNVFVAHLPVSVGLEYGWNAKWIMGGKTKVKDEFKAGGTSESTEYYTQSNNPFGNPDNLEYEKLSKKEFGMDTNQNVRLVLNIYFGN